MFKNVVLRYDFFHFWWVYEMKDDGEGKEGHVDNNRVQTGTGEFMNLLHLTFIQVLPIASISKEESNCLDMDTVDFVR